MGHKNNVGVAHSKSLLAKMTNKAISELHFASTSKRRILVQSLSEENPLIQTQMLVYLHSYE